MEEEEIRKAIKRAELEHILKGECLSTIGERVTRYLELNFSQLTPNAHWASISAECILLYRDGHFFACIALCQAVAEAIVRDLCKRNILTLSKNFEANVNRLCSNEKISAECKGALETIWKGRNDYHHLNPEVPTEREKLQAIARTKMIALHAVESEIFAFELVSGAIKPKHPKYWPEAQDG
ncbi:unnamed protein product, partial [marine sediment metagenome]